MKITNNKDLGFANIQYTFHFSYNINKNSSPQESLEGFRAKIRKDLKNLKGEIVYIYFFTDKNINITIEDSIAYIGRSKSISQKNFERFLHEIYDDNSIKDKAKQYTLTHFYINGIALQLEIFFVNKCREIEKELLTAHKEVFGYLPIANRKEG